MPEDHRLAPVPSRIHVIGGMGTGKTFLARRAGALIDAPVHEMDLGFEAGLVLDEKRWITEGVYLWGIEPILDAAQVVVWLDLPYRTCFRRIVTRHFWLSARGQNRHRGLRRQWAFLQSTGRYWKADSPRAPTGPTDWAALTRVQTVESLRPYMDKVTRLDSRRAVMSWLSDLSVGRG